MYIYLMNIYICIYIIDGIFRESVFQVTIYTQYIIPNDISVQKY